MQNVPAPAPPDVLDPEKVGEYPALVRSGGGYVWDEVLEYRVWMHPEHGADDLHDGHDYYYCFDTYADALDFASETSGAEEPLALVLQREYIDEPSLGDYRHVREERLTEWPVEFLSRPRRNDRTIPDFLASTDPDRLARLRGEA